MSSSTSPDGLELIKYSAGYLKSNSIGQLIVASIGSVVFQVTIGVNRVIDAITHVFVEPLMTLVDVSTDLFAATVGGPVTFLDFTARETGPLLVEQFGVLSFLAAVAISYGVLLMTSKFLQEQETSDLFPGTFTDWPVIGTTEEGETDDE